jgi:tripartite-type tricarboxylate transporter receptor subunit TctC
VVTDLIAGNIQVAFTSSTAVAPHVRSGRLRSLGVTTPERSALAPELPTIAESGLPGYEAAGLDGFMAPAKTPPAIIARLNQEAVRFLLRPDTKEKFLPLGIEPVSSSVEETASKIKSEISRWSKVIKDAGIKAE